MDPIAKEKFFKGVEFQECSPCRSGPNPFVSRVQPTLSIDVERADQMRGLRRIEYNDPALPGASFWCLDEKRTKCLDEEGNKVEESILPDGYMLAFNSNNHAPIALHGKIQNRESNEVPQELWVRPFDCENSCGGDDSKFGIRMETAPMHFNRRENTIGGLYIAPNECPPRTKGVSKNACNPWDCLLYTSPSPRDRG